MANAVSVDVWIDESAYVGLKRGPGGRHSAKPAKTDLKIVPARPSKDRPDGGPRKPYVDPRRIKTPAGDEARSREDRRIWLMGQRNLRDYEAGDKRALGDDAHAFDAPRATDKDLAEIKGWRIRGMRRPRMT